MLVKRYHAPDMAQAMDTIIKELGSDAVVLSNRKVRQKGFFGLFKKPILEVMVAYDPAKLPAAKKLHNGNPLPPSVPVYGSPAGSASFGSAVAQAYGNAQAYGGNGHAPPQEERREHPERRHDDLAQQAAALARTNEQLASLDERIESIDQMLESFVRNFSHLKKDVTYDYSDEVSRLVGLLIENQVREELAHAIARETDAILRTQEDSTALEIMEHLILELLGQPDPVQPKKFKCNVILMLGPTGVGKTTSLVKLAASFSVKQKKKVGIINTDTFRIAAQEQIKTYADILSIPLNIVYQTSELAEAIEEMSDRDVIFIDTAGKRPGDEQHKEDVTDIIEVANPDDVLLCVAAPTSFAAVKEVIDTYDFVEDYKLMVTKLDETRYRGMVLNLSWYAKKNLAYVTTGQNVPDDIEQIDMQAIVNELLK